MPDRLVDADLAAEASVTAQAVRHAFIEKPGRRAAAVFLGRDDYPRLRVIGSLDIQLMLECLPKFLHEFAGQIVHAARPERDGVGDPVRKVIEVDGQARQVLLEGWLFVHFPQERYGVSVEREPWAAQRVWGELSTGSTGRQPPLGSRCWPCGSGAKWQA